MHVLTSQGISSITVPDELPALLRDFTKDVIRAQVGPIDVFIMTFARSRDV